MANLMLVLVLVIFLDIFIGFPALFIESMLKADFWTMLITVAGMIGLPLIVIVAEMYGRSKYPIRAYISYRIGGQSVSSKTVAVEDRIGYVDVIGAKNQATGVKEWRLRNTQKPVLNFNYDYVFEQKIMYGFKKVQACHVNAVMGEKGEEFRPVKYDASLGAYKPVFDGERGMLFYKITQSIEARNKFENWWKTNLFNLALGGIALLIAALLFMCFLELKTVSQNLASAASAATQCSDNYRAVLNGSSTQKTTVQPGNVAGIPFLTQPTK